MALNVGELFGSLAWRHDKAGADEFDHRYDQAQAKARKKIEAQLGAAVDEKAFAKYHESLDRAERRAKARDAFKATLGADFDGRAFNAYSRALDKAERDARKAHASTKSFSDEIQGLNVRMPQLGKTMGLLKWPALIAGAGMAAQAVSAATAGVAALGSALAPLSGALAAYPALGSAAGQGLGVFKLATAGLGDGLSAAAAGGKEWEDALKKLTPQQAQFIRDIKPVIDHVKGLQATAREGFLPGAERGILAANKNFGVLNDGVGRTSKVLGGLAEQAGKLLGSKGFGRDMDTQMRRNDTTIRRLGDAGLHLFDALRHVTLAAGPLIDWLTHSIDHFAKLTDQQAKAGRESGKLAHFFDETRIAISRVVRIGADLAVAFFNIGKAGKPLGDDVLVNLVKAAEHFKDWTQSASGQNKIARYFHDARAPLFELGKLVHDVGVDFFNLGKGNQLAPMIRTIRVDLLPRFVALVDATTKSFGPPMLDAIKQVAILFTTLGGTNGPLTMLVKLVGKVAEGINKATDAIPGLGSAISSLSTVASLYAALRIASTLSGLSRIIRLIKDARAASVGSAAVSTGAGVAQGAAAGAATRTGAASTVAAVVSRFPIAAIAAAIVAAMGKPLLDTIRRKSPLGDIKSDNVVQGVKALNQFNAQLDRLKAIGDQRGVDKLAGQFDKLVDSSGKFKGSTRDINRLISAAKDLADAGGTTQRTLGRDLDRAAAHFADFRRTGSNNLEGIRHATTDNMHFIRRTLGEDSAAGKEALARNFRLARTAIRQAMADGRISVKDGLAEIQRLMRAELKQYGITGGVASSIIKHGNIKGSDAPAAGHARGGWVAKARHAVGGWIGRRGMVSGDVVPIAPGALAAYGEYVAQDSTGRAAVLNRHQAPVADMALAVGGYPGLDQGADLSTIERALAPLGGLDRLFSAITRPHYFAGGGRLRRFANGGLHLPESINVTHQTAGLAGYPAQDIFAAPGTPVFAPVAGVIARLSGQAGGPGGGGAFGYSIYENGANGRSYFLTHFGSTRVRPGQHVDRSTIIGTVADYPGGVPDHIHEGVHGGLTGITAGGPSGAPAAPMWKDIKAPQTGSRGALGAIVQATLDRVTAGANQRGAALAAASGGTGAGVVGPITGSGSGMALMRSIAKQKGWNFDDWWNIDARETGHGANLVNPTSTARLRGQFLSQNWGKYGPGSDPRQNPSMDEQIRSMAQYIAQRYGNPTAAWRHEQQFGWYGRGGRVRGFQSGGRLSAIGSAAGRAVGKAASGIGTKLHIKSLASMQTDRNGRFDAIMGRVDDARADYQRWDARYNLTDEGELIDQTTGEPNTRAINQKLSELANLAITRKFIEDQLEEARAVARQIVKTYNTIIRSLTRSLRHTKGKDRSGIRSRIKTYQGRLTEWQDKLKTVGGDVFDAHTDVIEIQGELADARAALGGSADIRAQYAQSLADAASQGADTGGAGATTTPDAAPAAPSAADIAAAAYQDVQAYLGQQRDLLTSFAGNAYTPRQAVGAGGVFSSHPDLQGAALGALRGFGGGANLAGSLGLGGSGPAVGVLNVNFQQPPDNAPTLISQLRFQVENGGVG